MKRNWREVYVDRLLDLCDPCDLHDLISTLEGIARALRGRLEFEASAHARNQFNRALAPWFIEMPDKQEGA